jgi:hypothetical protein
VAESSDHQMAVTYNEVLNVQRRFQCF